MQLARHSLTTVLAQATTAGSTSINGMVDCANYEGAKFTAVAGSTSVKITLTISTAATSTGSFVNVTGGTHSTTGGNDLAEVDVYRPRKRWLKATCTSTAAGEKVLLATRYAPREIPISSTAATVVISPNT